MAASASEAALAALAAATAAGAARTWWLAAGSARLLRRGGGVGGDGSPARDAAVRLLLPVFHEQDRVNPALEHFAALAAGARGRFDLQVVVVTTAREEAALESGARGRSTWEAMRETAAAINARHGRTVVRHLHYPGRAGWKPHQLNFAIRRLQAELADRPPQHVLFGVYDIDARPSPSTVDALASAWTAGVGWPEAGQQLSVYHPDPAPAPFGAVWGALGALWQTRWTLAVERPMLGRRPGGGALRRLSWCVGNGLFLRLDLFRRLGGLSERFYTEDMELGYRLSLSKTGIRVIGGCLETGAPSGVLADVRQKAMWFNGLLDYPAYAAAGGAGAPRLARWWLSAQGVLRGVVWLSLFPLVALLLGAALARGLDALGALCLVAGLLFVWGGFGAALAAVRALPDCVVARASLLRAPVAAAALVLGPLFVMSYSLGPYLCVGRRVGAVLRRWISRAGGARLSPVKRMG